MQNLMGIPYSDLQLIQAIRDGIAQVRQYPILTQYIFGPLFYENFKTRYGDKELQKIKNWFQNTQIPVVQGFLRMDKPQLPIITVRFLGGPESKQHATLSDGDGQNLQEYVEEEYYSEPRSLLGPFSANYNITTGILTLPEGTYSTDIFPGQSIYSPSSQKQYQIINVTSTNTITIGAGIQDSFQNITVKPAYPNTKIKYNKVTFAQNYEIGIYTGIDTGQLTYLSFLVQYILLKYRRDYLEAENINISSFSAGPIEQGLFEDTNIQFIRQNLNLEFLAEARIVQDFSSLIEGISPLTINLNEPATEVDVETSNNGANVEISVGGINITGEIPAVDFVEGKVLTEHADGSITWEFVRSSGNNSSTSTAQISYPIINGEVGVLHTNYDYGDIRRYGGVNDNGTPTGTTMAANSAALLNAYNSALNAGFKKISFPAGSFTINSSLAPSVAPSTPLIFEGQGLLTTTIVAGASMNAVFDFGSLSCTNLEFRNFRINCASAANYGIYSTNLTRSKFYNFGAYGALIDGSTIGDGYINTFEDCEFTFNSRDGISFVNGAINGLNFRGGVLEANGRFGATVNGSLTGDTQRSSAVNFYGTVIEANHGGGIYIVGGVANPNIEDCYFEGNGDTGVTLSGYTTSNQTTTWSQTFYNGDIIVNSSTTSTFIQQDSTVYGLQINGCLFDSSAGGSGYANIVLLSVDGAEISNNTGNNASPLIGVMGRVISGSAPVVANVNIHGNRRFLNNLVIYQATSGQLPLLQTWTIDAQPLRQDLSQPSRSSVNYLQKDLLQWTKTAGGAGRFMRSAETYKGFETWEYAGASDQFYTSTIDLTVYPELAGQWAMLSFWSRSTTNAAYGIRGFLNGYGTIDSVNVGNGWQLFSVTAQLPNSGTFNVQFKLDNFIFSDFDSCKLACPALTVLGRNPSSLFVDSSIPVRHFQTNSAPSQGYWRVGDIIEYTTITSGNRGSVCTSEGYACIISWAPSHTYVQFDQVVNGSNVYECTTGGQSAGSGGPSGTGSSISDNTVVWRYLGAVATFQTIP